MEPSSDSDYINFRQGDIFVLRVAKGRGAKLAAAVAAAALVLTPAIATGSPAKKRPTALAFSFDPISSFTPANADPKLAAALGSKSLALGDFKFTPAAAKGRSSQFESRFAPAWSVRPSPPERILPLRQLRSPWLQPAITSA